MRFDLTINLGHVVVLGTLIASVITTWSSYYTSITNSEIRITRLEKAIETHVANSQDLSENISSLKQDIAILRYRIERVDRPK
jgi:hypothetical protein